MHVELKGSRGVKEREKERRSGHKRGGEGRGGEGTGEWRATGYTLKGREKDREGGARELDGTIRTHPPNHRSTTHREMGGGHLQPTQFTVPALVTRARKILLFALATRKVVPNATVFLNDPVTYAPPAPSDAMPRPLSWLLAPMPMDQLMTPALNTRIMNMSSLVAVAAKLVLPNAAVSLK